MDIERSCAVIASALSDGVCENVRLITGERRMFDMNVARTVVNVPWPALTQGWTLRTWACGIALQCAPSKRRIATYTLRALSPRQATALSIVEGGVALGWLSVRWPGLVPEFRRFLRRYQWACLFKGKTRATAEASRSTRILKPIPETR